MNVSKTSILDQNKREMEKPCLVLKNSLQILCQLPFLHRLHILSIIEVNAFSVDKPVTYVKVFLINFVPLHSVKRDK
jgi:hypothetical protein